MFANHINRQYQHQPVHILNNLPAEPRIDRFINNNPRINPNRLNPILRVLDPNNNADLARLNDEQVFFEVGPQRGLVVQNPAARVIRRNDLPELQRLLLRNDRSANSNAFSYAASLGRDALVEAFLTAGFQPSENDFQPLRAAIHNHQLDTERLLFSRPNSYPNGQLPPGHLRQRALVNILAFNDQDMSLVLNDATLNAPDVRNALTAIHNTAVHELNDYVENSNLLDLDLDSATQVIENIFGHRLFGWEPPDHRSAQIRALLEVKQAEINQ